MKKLGVPQLVAGLCIGVGLMAIGLFSFILNPELEGIFLSATIGAVLIAFGIIVLFVMISVYILSRKDDKGG